MLSRVNATPLPPRSRAVFAIALALVLVQIAYAARYGIFRDEMYYVACGNHLAFGYVDHPPLIALMARVEVLFLGDSPRALRFLPALLAGANVIVAAELARALRGGAFAQVLVAVCVVVTPEFLGLFHILSMNAVLPVAWTACALFVTRAVVENDERAWLWFGLVAGVGLEAKHSTLFFGAALAIGLLATPHRRLFLTRGPWIAFAIAALLLAPNLLWEQTHGWPTLEFMHNAQTKKMVAMTPLDFLGATILDVHPLTLPVWLGGLAWLFAAERGRPYRFLGVAFLAVAVIIVAGKGKPYYLAPAFPVVYAAGGVALESWIARRLVRAAVIAALALGGVALAPFALPILDAPAFIAYAGALGVTPPADEKHTKGPLPQFQADQFGWEAMARKVADAYRGLSPEEQKVAAFFGDNYGEASAVAFFGPRLGLPPAVVSGHNSYFLWGPPPGGRGEVMITVGVSREDVLESYEEVEQVGETDEPYAMPYENHQPILVAKKLRRPMEQIWPTTKDFI
jgi:hypothetical protein